MTPPEMESQAPSLLSHRAPLKFFLKDDCFRPSRYIASGVRVMEMGPEGLLKLFPDHDVMYLHTFLDYVIFQ